jgi:hypothetical protein
MRYEGNMTLSVVLVFVQNGLGFVLWAIEKVVQICSNCPK